MTPRLALLLAALLSLSACEGGLFADMMGKAPASAR